MATEITGYTITAGTTEEPGQYTLTTGYPGSGREGLLWDIADLLKADLEDRYPTLTFVNGVTRHERESVILTHP